MTKIFAIGMIKNEADIIESFVRYHSHLFDGIVLLDNGSTDNTVSILEQLMAEGLPLTVINDTSLEYAQAQKTTGLMVHTFEEYDPDFIFPLDADEFVVATDGRHPREKLNALDPNKVYYNQMRDYVPQPSDHEKELLIPKRVVHSCGDDDWYKVVVSKQIFQRYSPVLTMGNHDLAWDEPIEEPPKEVFEHLRLAHYSIRSLEQAKSKILVGYLNYLSSPDRKEGDAVYWRKWFYILKQRQDLNFQDVISDYYRDARFEKEPLDLSFCQSLRLKYTKADEVNALRNLLNYYEGLAQEYANLKRSQA